MPSIELMLHHVVNMDCDGVWKQTEVQSECDVIS